MYQPLDIPPRGGNWEQYYISPKTGKDLVRGKQIGNWQWQHIDTSTNRTLISNSLNAATDYDGVVISLVHDTWAIAAIQLGLAYKISGNKFYANKAKDILLAYATLYPTLPLHNKNYEPKTNDNLGGGKIHTQSLNEALWLIDIVESFDLVNDVLNTTDNKLIIEKLLKPAADIIASSKSEISNIQCWKNTAIGLIGLVTNDKKYIDYALLNKNYGINAQIAKGFSKDGYSIDMSPSYHFYALNALVVLANAAKNAGFNIDINVLEPLFSMPVELATSSLTIPAFNDSKIIGLRGESFLYEWAYKTFGNKEYLPIISKLGREKFQNIGPTYTGWFLLFGIDSLPSNSYTLKGSKNFSETGLLKLSSGFGSKNVTAFIKYNDQRTSRGHFHHAQMDFSIFKGTEQVAVISGNNSYASPLANDWYRNSIAHNTLTVNQNQQSPSSATCLGFGTTKSINYTVLSSTNMYDSIRFFRTIAIIDSNTIAVIDQISSLDKKENTFDITYHQEGVWKQTLKDTLWGGSSATGYDLIKDAFIADYVSQCNLSTTLRSGMEAVVSAISDKKITVITGYGAPFMNKDVPVVIYRTYGKSTVLAYCISLDGNKRDLVVEPLLNSSNQLLNLSESLKLSITSKIGKKSSIIVNPLKNNIKDKKNSEVTVFDVE